MDSITRGNLINKGSITNVGVQTLTRIFIVGGKCELVNMIF